jgi:DUF1680 family protein
VIAVNDKDLVPDVREGFVRIHRTWSSGDIVRVSFPFKPRVVTRKCADGAPFASVCQGPLLFTLPIPTEGGDLNRPQAGAAWQFALAPDASATVR